MARLARFIIAGVPHHVTQRGNGRQRTFFSDADYALYRDLLKEHCARAGVSVWSWVPMPNHVHLILTPSHRDGIRAALSRVHRVYAGHVHAREKRTGHFWQGRFGCVAMDEAHLDPARGDGLTDTAPVLTRVEDFAALLRAGEDEAMSQVLRRSETIGRPLGDDTFLERINAALGRDPRPAKRGPRKKLNALSP